MCLICSFPPEGGGAVITSFLQKQLRLEAAPGQGQGRAERDLPLGPLGRRQRELILSVAREGSGLPK